LVGATEATIRWSAHPSGTSGQVFGTQNVTVAQIVAGYTIPWSEISLNGDGYAYFSVQWQAAGDQAASAWSSDATAAIPPPTALTASNQYNSDGSFAGVALSWTAPAVSNQPSSYNILGPYAGDVLGTQGGYATTAFVPAYAASPVAGSWGEFEATVQAVYGGLGSLPAGSAAATNAAPLPALLTSGVSGTAASASAQLSWTPAGTTPLPTFYRIFYYYYTGGSTLHLAYVDIAAPAATYTLRGLTSGQAYSIAVVTYNAAGTAEVFAAGVPTLSEIITVTPS
jgi:hypothetical protein